MTPCCEDSNNSPGTAYISASHILRREYSGSRLEAMFKKYSPNMMDYWPYLRKRKAEAKAKKRQFGGSFLGKHLSPFPTVISSRLWACDDSKRLVMATK